MSVLKRCLPFRGTYIYPSYKSLERVHLYDLFQMSLPVVAPGEQVIEMMIPASKVGLIIGKLLINNLPSLVLVR